MRNKIIKQESLEGGRLGHFRTRDCGSQLTGKRDGERKKETMVNVELWTFLGTTM